ncbi:hypothetical protein [Saccharibacillus alkalitolerans]|uniref:Uncharacterized protein n=1 Tax=Saccharibacillus alkalitolerans TaxID=2705290 RepID=A0ABX0F3H6_9BACL|nr:hypothetical protein [Saccharibacillus alkalitolerans]NGZ74430.1 hypothetical protein [Saccharibacillus alkalitolerans]
MTNESIQKLTENENADSANMEEKLTTLRGVTDRLERSGVDYVVGGSGMLFGLGLTDRVRDWDIMTEAPESEIRRALGDLELSEESGPSELYGSGCKLTVQGTEPEVEVIIGFAVRARAGICRLPALSGGLRNGLRIASPEVWLAAYTLMGRTEKADLLESYLQERGADPSALSRLREQPLPSELAERLNRLPAAPTR